MFWVFYLTPYLPYMFSPCYVTEVLQHFLFALDLKTAYEGELMFFGLLHLANLTQDDVLQISFFFTAE
jgi:hypothetical protein